MQLMQISRRRGWTDEKLSWYLVDVAYGAGNVLAEEFAGFGVCEEVEGE